MPSSMIATSAPSPFSENFPPGPSYSFCTLMKGSDRMHSMSPAGRLSSTPTTLGSFIRVRIVASDPVIDSTVPMRT